MSLSEVLVKKYTFRGPGTFPQRTDSYNKVIVTLEFRRD